MYIYILCVYIYVHTHTYNIHIMEYYSAIKKEILPFVTTWMNLEGIMLSKVRQKDKYCIVSLICGIIF